MPGKHVYDTPERIAKHQAQAQAYRDAHPDRGKEQKRREKERLKRDLAEHKPTEEQRNQVKALCYLKTDPIIIAKLLGVSKTVLDKKYRDELKHGAALVAASLGMKIVQNAVKGDKGALGQIARAQGIGRQETPPPPPRAKNDPEPDPFDLTTATDEDLSRILGALAGGNPSEAGRGHKG